MIKKNGPGKATFYLSEGNYGFDMDGPGDVVLKGISDYSGVSGKKNGPGNLRWCPVDEAKGKPPTIQKDGPGSISKGC
jgi:hypothetical protein